MTLRVNMSKKEKRLFKKSDYEKTFKVRFVQRYRGIDICLSSYIDRCI